MAEDFARRAHRQCGWLKRISLAGEQMNQLIRIVMCFGPAKLTVARFNLEWLTNDADRFE